MAQLLACAPTVALERWLIEADNIEKKSAELFPERGYHAYGIRFHASVKALRIDPTLGLTLLLLMDLTGRWASAI